jgi:Bacterial protein of unknown function (DUF885)
VSILILAFAAAAAAEKPKEPDWVVRSNQNTRIVLESEAQFAPEAYGSLGVEGLDEKIVDLKPALSERTREAASRTTAELESRLARETDPLVRQDLEILIKNTKDSVRGSLMSDKYDVPYYNVARLVFRGLHGLLDDQVAANRRPAALVRLRRYAGLEKGFTALTKLAEARTRERLATPGLYFPARIEIEKDLADQTFLVDGIGKLFTKYGIDGYQAGYDALKEQLADYERFVRAEILPHAREDFRQPPEEYAFALEQFGVDIPPAELIKRAHAAFDDIQAEMATLSPLVAHEKGLAATDYRSVVHELKKKQLTGEAILPFFKTRLGEIESIIRQEHLVTLPDRPARIRLASEAESAVQPAPHMEPPRLLKNTGEEGAFVLPLNKPAAPGSKEATQSYDDFAFDAGSWTVTAHEARPGHELQFASMVEKGVSDARAIYAFNSTNVEGWGLYAEAILLPFMPPEGRLISYQLRLLRAARAFLDPELQAGTVTPEQAKSVLMDDVCLSDAFASEEVERFTFRAPGQATSYFYGYTRLMQLRSDVEKALGPHFDQQKFHDFVLAQGLLPPDLLRKAVMSNFVAATSATVAGRSD